MLTRAVLLWDGDCGACRRWARRVERWDRRGAIETLAASRRADHPGLPPIPDAALDRAMHLVLPDGRVLAGGRAIPEIVRRLPGGRAVTWVFRLPGVQRAVDWGYARLAARRARSCEADGSR